MLEFQDRHADLLGHIELIENLLGIVGAVIISNPGMIAADDEMGAAVILADQGVQDRLRGPAYRIASGITVSMVRSLL